MKLTICATLPRFNPSQAQVMTPHYSAQLQVLWRWTSGEATAQDRVALYWIDADLEFGSPLGVQAGFFSISSAHLHRERG